MFDSRIRWSIIPVLVVGVGISVSSRVSGRADEELIEGDLLVRARGSGAAPFGIASGFLMSSNMGINLGRLQHSQAPQALPGDAGVGIDERYQVQVRFKLRPSGKNQLELYEADFTYGLACNTSITYEAGTIVAPMHDSGRARWKDGRWIIKPTGWDPSANPGST